MIELTPVERTALWMSELRALETGRPDRLFADPYAGGLAAAAGPGPSPIVAMAGPDSPMGDLLALRTRFVDDVCARATDVRQVVLLAAGLDTRAYRLDWPAGTVLYELDTAPVLALKERLIEDEPRCGRRTAAADLRGDWPAALAGAGFDPAEPALWLVEGLLGYLPAPAARDLLAALHRLSAPGSRIALEDFHLDAAMSPLVRRQYAEAGLAEPPMAPAGDRPPAALQLAGLGWRTEISSIGQLAVLHGRPVPPNFDAAVDGSAAQSDDRYRMVEAVLRTPG